MKEDAPLAELLRREDEHYLGVVDLIAASNAPTWRIRVNSGWGVAQFRSAEGYPGKRPYAGTANFDAIERLAMARACSLYGAEHANVQPLSGTLANMAAFRALLCPGDTVLSMSMRAGGHLSHGHPRHLVSETYHIVSYSTDPTTGLLDFGSIARSAREARPKVIVAGFSAYPRHVNFAQFAEIAHGVGAHLVADISHIAGLVAAGLHPNPCDVGAVVTSSVEKTLRGTRGGFVLCPSGLADVIDRAVFPGLQSSVGLAGLVSLCSLLHEAMQPQFRIYQERVVAYARLLGDALQRRGVGLVTGGTDTHLLLLDVGALGLSGRASEQRLDSIGILSNRNMIPGDPRPPFEASGLRLGTPTITARGFDADDVAWLGDTIGGVLTSSTWNDSQATAIREQVRALAWRERPDDTLRDLREAFSTTERPHAAVPTQ